MIKRIVMAISIILCFTIPCIVQADVYKWVDEKGTLHFTDDESTIPDKYREQAEKVDLPEGSKFIEGGGQTSRPAEGTIPGSEGQDTSLWFSGVINTVGTGQISVTGEGKNMIFLMTQDTKIQTSDEKNVSAGELLYGRPVTIEYVKRGEENVARTIRVTLVQEKPSNPTEEQVGGAGQQQNPSDVQKDVWDEKKKLQQQKPPNWPQLPKNPHPVPTVPTK
jgi:hypothetical protein